MKRLQILLTVFISLFFNESFANQNTLEITVPLSYEPLSKIQSNYVVGSSSIIIDKLELVKYKDLPLHSIIEKVSGIKARSIYGFNSSGSKTTIDIRGMGAQAKSNVLILVNGQRLNNIDMGEIDFPSIPLESIEKIEIIKGNAASVLYGDGAIGGTINIITNNEDNKLSKNELNIISGSFHNQSISYSNIINRESSSISSFFNHNKTDGYRDENEQKQNNFTAEIKLPYNSGSQLFKVSFSEQLMSTPSDRSQSQLYSDRRGSDTPDDFVNSVGGSLLYGLDYKIKESAKFLLNASMRLKNSSSDLQSTAYPSQSDTNLENYQITPRINIINDFLNKELKSTYGLDLQFADYGSDRKKNKDVAPLHVYDASQHTQSLYAQHEIKLNKNFTLGTGLRIQRNDITIKDRLDRGAVNYTSYDIEHDNYAKKEINYAYNFGLGYDVSSRINVFSRFGSGFRYANIDDRIGGSGSTSFDLNTQKTLDYEIGVNFNTKKMESKIITYVIDAKNEIAYDADNYVNYNLSNTRRVGLELYLKNKFNKKISMTNSLTFVKAKFTSNPNTENWNSTVYNSSRQIKGNDIPLVPNFSFDSNLDLKVNDYLTILPSLKYQDDMRMENDEENFQNTKIPGYLLFNIGAQSKFKKFLIFLNVNNIFDEKYFNYAVSSSNTLGSYNAYPEPGRVITLRLKVNF